MILRPIGPKALLRVVVALRGTRLVLLAAGIGLASMAPACAQILVEEQIGPEQVKRWLVRQGFVEISRPRLRGDTYVVEALNQTDKRFRFVIDAFNGNVIQSRIVGRVLHPNREVERMKPPHRREAAHAPPASPAGRLAPVRPADAKPSSPAASPSVAPVQARQPERHPSEPQAERAGLQPDRPAPLAPEPQPALAPPAGVDLPEPPHDTLTIVPPALLE